MSTQTATEECAETLSRVADTAMRRAEEGAAADNEASGATEAIKKAAEEVAKNAPYKMMLTPLGERWVYKTEGEDYVAPLSIMEYPGKPLSVALHDLMCTLYTASQEVVRLKRLVPLTRTELLAPTDKGGCTKYGYKKGELQKLEKKGLAKINHAHLSSKNTKKSVGSRVVVYLTALGRGYVQKHIDKEFMSDGEVQQDN